MFIIMHNAKEFQSMEKIINKLEMTKRTNSKVVLKIYMQLSHETVERCQFQIKINKDKLQKKTKMSLKILKIYVQLVRLILSHLNSSFIFNYFIISTFNYALNVFFVTLKR